jgi:hypothetical protein
MRFYTVLAHYASNEEIIKEVMCLGNNVNVSENQKRFTPQNFANLLKFWDNVQTENPNQWRIPLSLRSQLMRSAIYSLVQNFATSGMQNVHVGLLSKIVHEYWLNNYLDFRDDEQQNTLVSSGLGFVLTDRQFHQKPEPAVLKAIINWFRDNNESLTYHYASQHSHLNPNAFGGIFDNIVAFCFLEKYGTTLEDIPLFKQTPIPFLTRAFQLQALRLEKQNLNDYIQLDNSSLMVCCCRNSFHLRNLNRIDFIMF